MIYDKIELIADMLDAILNLRCFYTKKLDSNLSFLKELIPSIFVNNQKEIDRFKDMLLSMVEEHVYILENFMFGNYVIICLDRLEKSYLFIGPFLSTNRYDDLLDNINDYNISDYDLDAINKYYNSLPVINMSKITSIISVIKNNIYDKGTDLKFIFKRNIKKPTPKEVNTHRMPIESLSHKFVEDSISLDKKLMHHVSSGSKVNSIKVLDKILDLYFEDNEIYNIRTYQNKLIYYNTLLSDMVKGKGVCNIYVASLFQRHMDKIESARFAKDIRDIFYEMIIDYCFAISEFNIKHYSALVGKVINYINSNLQNNLSVNEIANLFYVSPTYLSRVFKKETGFSVIEYINKLKIKHATFLLRDTALPIQDIGRIIGINDVNYFSRLFKKYMSQTPTQYRKIFN